MNNKTLDKATTILDEYFAGSLPLELEADIRVWLAGGENRNEKDFALEQIWDRQVNYDPAPGAYARESLQEISSLLGLPAADATPTPEIQTMQLPRRRNLLFRVAAVVLPLLLLAGATVLWLTRTQEPEWILVTADSGSQKHFFLPDDSEVWLNPDSRISYPENFDRNREVKLNGEAFFSVAKQENAPFTVSTGSVNVTVHGTRFLVTAPEDKDRTTVTLHSGSVAVTAGSSQTELKPGEQLRYFQNSDEIYVEEVELEDWTKPSLDFYDASLEEIFVSLEKNFDITIQVDRPLPAMPGYSIRFFAAQDVDDVLRILSNLTRTFTYTIHDAGVVEISLKE